MASRRLALKTSQHACTCSKYKMFSIVYMYLKMEYCYHQKFLYNYTKTLMLTTPQPFCRRASSFFYIFILYNRIIYLLYPLKSSSPPVTHTSTLHFLFQSSAHLFTISFSISTIIYQSLCFGVCLHYISGTRTSVRLQ